jgi:hypothetical protein
MEFASFALPADPAPLTLVPNSPTVQQEEARARGRGSAGGFYRAIAGGGAQIAAMHRALGADLAALISLGFLIK